MDRRSEGCVRRMESVGINRKHVLVDPGEGGRCPRPFPHGSARIFDSPNLIENRIRRDLSRSTGRVSKRHVMVRNSKRERKGAGAIRRRTGAWYCHLLLPMDGLDSTILLPVRSCGGNRPSHLAGGSLPVPPVVRPRLHRTRLYFPPVPAEPTTRPSNLDGPSTSAKIATFPVDSIGRPIPRIHPLHAVFTVFPTVHERSTPTNALRKPWAGDRGGVGCHVRRPGAGEQKPRGFYRERKPSARKANHRSLLQVKPNLRTCEGQVVARGGHLLQVGPRFGQHTLPSSRCEEE